MLRTIFPSSTSTYSHTSTHKTKYHRYQVDTQDLDDVSTPVSSIRYPTIPSPLPIGSPRSDSPHGPTALQPRIDPVWYLASRPRKSRDQSGRDRLE
jgi:hypothetical protein